jgi:hypothetical protein
MFWKENSLENIFQGCRAALKKEKTSKISERGAEGK